MAVCRVDTGPTPGQFDDEPKGDSGSDRRMVQRLFLLGGMQLDRRGIDRVSEDTDHPDQDP